MQFKNRTIFALISLICICTIAYAFYAQYYQNQQPCPLCIAQRVIIAIIGIVAILGFLTNGNWWLSRIIALINTGFAIFGIKTAYHHVWLQNLPLDQQPLSCGMPLEIMYKRLPLDGFLKYILAGDGECAKISWKIFGISAPMASLILFIILGLLSFYVVIKRNRHTHHI